MPFSELFSFLAAALRATTPLEAAGAVTGVACVWLAARNSVWNFPVAMVSCGLYMVIFGRARIYSDAGLQVAFIALAAYGWWGWQRRHHRQGAALAITATAANTWVGLLAFVLLYTGVAGFLLDAHTDAALPYYDSGTTAISLVAQYLLSRRKLENWLLWLGVDALYVGLYWQRGLYVTTALYFFFLLLAAYGYRQWRRELTSPAVLA